MSSRFWLKELATTDTSAELPVITLTRARDGKTFKGPGSVVRGVDGRLRLKLYSSAEFKDGLGLIDSPAGTLVPKQDLFELDAVDMHGHRWQSNGIWPHASVSLPTRMAVVTGKIHRLVGERSSTVTTKSHLSVALHSDAKFPVNQREQTERKIGDTLLSANYSRSAAELEFDGLKIRLFRDDDLLLAQVTGEWPVVEAENFAWHVVSALQFMLGCRLQADVITLSNGEDQTQIVQGVARERLRSKTEPPRNWAAVDDEGVTWDLFKAFLRFVRHAPTAQAKELCRWTAEVIDTGSAPLEVSSLVLSVAVEGIVGLLQGEECKDETFLRDIEVARHLATAAEFPVSLKSRIVGAIDAMKKPRARDFLKDLAQQGAIPAEHVEAWLGLRNASAHAHVPDRDWIEPTVRKSSVVLALYYRLVFMLIEYRGPYTDYSLIGWPEKVPTDSGQ